MALQPCLHELCLDLSTSKQPKGRGLEKITKPEPVGHQTKRHRRMASVQIQALYTKVKKRIEPKAGKSLVQALIGVILVLLGVGITQHWEFL